MSLYVYYYFFLLVCIAVYVCSHLWICCVLYVVYESMYMNLYACIFLCMVIYGYVCMQIFMSVIQEYRRVCMQVYMSAYAVECPRMLLYAFVCLCMQVCIWACRSMCASPSPPPAASRRHNKCLPLWPEQCPGRDALPYFKAILPLMNKRWTPRGAPARER